MDVKRFLKREWPTLLGTAAGALGGWLYFIYVGCDSGSCPITSSPVMSAVWGAAVGGILFSMFRKKKNSDE
ncbi:Uncharacterised protein [Alistipes sp. cv1]|jgi:hypothetical protein|nr:DUF6132 family protein [uncultured Alistipes sp.]VDR35486.1 Uncharacterised protein [Faecalibacterium prausnitzii]